MKDKIIYGVGINDAAYPTRIRKSIGYKKQKLIWSCPFYATWQNMLLRCYDMKYQERQPTYKGCFVCEEWLTFSKFRDWMETQDWEGKQLDKDLLVKGNKVYSPNTCVFVSRAINAFILERDQARGMFQIGVHWNKNFQKFRAYCNNPFTKKQEHLGLFDNQEDAHQAWLKRKLELAKMLAAEQDDPRVAEALVKRYENYKEDK